MRVPDEITVQVVSDDAVDLHDIIVELVVSTGRRNPRRLRFPKTDRAGRSTLAFADFVGQFSDATQQDIMGSWGTIDDALPAVEISLHDTEPAVAAGLRQWPLGKHERTRWSSPAEEYAYRTSSRNGEFTAPAVVVNLHESARVVLRVTPATGRTG
jgi:hypothetical protein